MALARRAQFGMAFAETNEPGIEMNPDGSMEVIEVDGSRSALPGGASFPAEWTVGADGSLAITGSNINSVPLSVAAAAGQQAAIFEVISEDGDRMVQVSTDSIVLAGVPGEQNSKLTLDDDGLQFKDELAGFPLTINGGILYFGTNATAQVIDDGYFAISAHAEPADGALSAGDCALWFDQTNGSPKLMVKAKRASGTVVTGSVDLSP